MSPGLIARMFWIWRIRFAIPRSEKASILIGMITSSAASSAAAQAALNAGGQSISI